MRFTFVLTPSSDQALKYVEASQKTFCQYQPIYLLNTKGTSSPHITIIQFECDSFDLAQTMWEHMCRKMTEIQFNPFTPSFTGVSFTEERGPNKGTICVALSVKRDDKDSPLLKMHYASLEILEYFGLEPLNCAGNNYQPHLTLALIVMPKQIKIWPKTLLENPGNFRLEFGRSDDMWRYAETLAVFKG